MDDDMKSSKKNAKTKENGSGLGVVLEHIDSKLDLVVEGQQALQKQITDNHEEFKEFRGEVNYKFGVVFENFEQIDKRFEGVDKRFQKVDDRFDKIDERFQKVDERFDRVDDDLHIIKNDLKEKVSRDEFVVLEKRLSHLEKKFSQLG